MTISSKCRSGFPESLLHLGGTRVLGVRLTMDAAEAIEMMRILNPGVAIPIPYNDYDVFKSPLSDFKREVEAAGLASRVKYLNHGEIYSFGLTKEAIMAEYADHDGKSKTASGNDPEHYPEMNESPNHSNVERAATHAEIAQRAYELWLEQGSPDNAAERNWLEAQLQLQSGGDSQNQIHDLHEKGGSVQR